MPLTIRNKGAEQEAGVQKDVNQKALLRRWLTEAKEKQAACQYKAALALYEKALKVTDHPKV